MNDDRSAHVADRRTELLRRRLQGQGGHGPDEPALVRRVSGERKVPSFGQRRLWFLDLLQPGHIGYNMPDASYRIRGALDVDALVRAIRRLVERHEVVRSRFESKDGEPIVIIDAAETFEVRLVDMTERDEAWDAVRRLACEEAETPFDLNTGPLVRASLVRLADDDHVLLVTFHHSVFDGWSIEVFQNDLSTAYAAMVRGSEPEFPELAVQYGDFAAWQRERLSGDVLEQQVQFWRDRLTGAAPALELPADRPRPMVPSHRGGVVEFVIGKEIAEELRGLARSAGASLFMVTLAAFQALLGRYAGTTDVVTGCPSAGRSRAELERLIGFFVNSLVVRTDVSGDPSFAELVGRVRSSVLEAFEHQDLPFERLVEELAPLRDLSRNPVIQVWFDLLAPGAPLALNGLDVERFVADSSTTRFDVELHLYAADKGTISAQLVYSSDLFDAASMERFAEHYVNLLRSAAAAPDAPLSEAQIMGAEELRCILSDWNDTGCSYRGDRTVSELFEERVGVDADAVAV
ncbi:condensation domain-containing protein, partial [Streptomyces hygroscopicus]|uniref:condensation domain-containing protein n=1 Tax=Streptomyces hygroscopicus TaxID=1912 RepID=UPI0036B46C70